MLTEPNPFKLFSELYQLHREKQPVESNAVVLSTATQNGVPSSRVVLIKSFDEDGFVFYTNLHSQKVRELSENPYAALCFYWEPIEYQIRIVGKTEKVPDTEADEYFTTRPRGSQIGAWASKQSKELENRTQLEERFKFFEAQFANREVPRPIFWSGFRVVPDKFEFWKRYENRLHERVIYNRINGSWKSGLLYP